MSYALYRRYRPERFEDVIGQEHVTGPLMQALRNDRVHHAYLFSGPRGCGKTTSARILARCLNCEQGPTPTPCGQCRSCQELAKDGPGNLDVVEIDAASHGGVDDARDLREKAFFAPASSRYKVYIVDEAHMVTSQGFNALLKIVEEPPPHLKFIFATTEPEKVIGTIRSRTHHYPFRLVPPKPLLEYLGSVCQAEGVPVERTVLPLVVRAGGGSVRDSLSVLDQLLAGAGADGVTYQLATGLLGFTDAALLDDIIDALAAADGAEVFRILDRVVEAGHNPRRLAEDLLERFRDLIVLDAVPDAAGVILGEAPPDQLDRMRGQAGRFGQSELSRAADLVNAGLTEMRGTMVPRLQLELICARILLPGAYDDTRSLQARLDRLERRLGVAGAVASETSPAATAPRAGATAAPRPAAAPSPAPVAPPATAGPEAAPPADPAPPAPVEPPVTAARQAAALPAPAPAQPATAEVAPAAQTRDPAAEGLPPAGSAGLDLTSVRRLWPDVLDRVKAMKRLTWTLLVHNAQVLSVTGDTLVLGMVNTGARDSFARVGSPEILRQACIDVLGVDWQVEAVVDPSVDSASATHSAGATPARTGEASTSTSDPAAGSVRPAGARPPRRPARTDAGPSAPAPAQDVPSDSDPDAASPPGQAPTAGRSGRRAPRPPTTVVLPRDESSPTEEVSESDPDVELDLTGPALLARELGAEVIDEYDEG